MKNLFSLFTPLIGLNSVLIAVSGGVDSMVMLSSLHNWVSVTPNTPQIYAATVNHNLRPNTQKECDMVALWCASRGVPHSTLLWHHEDGIPKTKLMELARNARYKLLEDHALALDISVILTAHHSDDQAETLLMRLSKGSGLTGLCAMMNVRELSQNLVLFRPFLTVEKQRLIDIAMNYNVEFYEDPSNTHTKFERVRVREHLKNFGISATHLNISIQRLQRAELALHEITQSFIAMCVAEQNYFQLSREIFDHAPSDVQIRILMDMVHHVNSHKETSYPLSLSAFERLHEAFSQAQGHNKKVIRHTLSHCEISISPNWIKVKQQTPRKS